MTQLDLSDRADDALVLEVLRDHANNAPAQLAQRFSQIANENKELRAENRRLRSEIVNNTRLIR